jgi:5-methyltetrahydropteroyltriglutamate--homocysteine methyltransferase
MRARPRPVTAERTAVAVPRFRAEHIGSLLRPKKLTEAYRAFRSGAMAAFEFDPLRDQAIRDAVTLQESLGFQAVTDGEFRRASYWSHLIGPVEGLTVRPSLFDFRDAKGEKQAFIAPHVAGRLARGRGISTDEYAALAKLTKRTAKITLPSPSTLHFWRGREAINPAAYRDLNSFFADLAAVYRAELAELGKLGCTYVQLDEVPLTMLCDPQVVAALRQRGEDPDLLTGFYVGALNDAVRDRPKTMTVGIHMCRGNFRGKWLAEGGYEPIAERVLGGLNVDHFLLEFDSPRAGDFKPLRFLPKDKGVVLGLVCSKTPTLEKIDDLRKRLDEAAKLVPLERLAVSPQCGFASAVTGNPVTADDQKKKLGLVAELAKKVWG